MTQGFNSIPTVPKGERLELADVLAEELKRLRYLSASEKARSQKGELAETFKLLHESDLKALCFSGGGIRSATFGLGVVQSLAKHRLLTEFDYLSTVSGGGYLGSWLSAWIRVELINSVEMAVCDRIAVGKCETISRQDCSKILQFAGCTRDMSATEKSRTVYARLQNYHKHEPERLSDEHIKLIDDEVAVALFEIDGTSTDGATRVENSLRENIVSGNSSPSTEPPPITHLREYSNYMTPKVGFFSADTWAFVGIYLRNLFLNWTIFIPLMAASLLLPRIFYPFTLLSKSIYLSPYLSGLTLVIGLISGGVSVAFVAHNLPSKKPQIPDDTTIGKKRDFTTNGWTLVLGIVPALVYAICITTLWSGAFVLRDDLVKEYSDYIPSLITYEPARYILFTVPVYIIGYVLFIAHRWRRFGWERTRSTLNIPSFLMALLASVVGGIILGLGAGGLRLGAFEQDGWIRQHVAESIVCFAVPGFLAVFLVQSALFVGLASKWTTDEDREWLARFGGWLLIIIFAWIAVNSLVLIGPLFLREIFSSAPGLFTPTFPSTITSLVAFVSGFISLVGGFSSKLPIKKDGDTKKRYRIISAIPQIASVIFLLFIVVGIAYLTAIVISHTATLVPEMVRGWGGSPYVDKPIDPNALSLDAITQVNIVYLVAWTAALAVVGFVMACFVNVNTFSLHGAYRDRLIRAYLGASNLYRRPNLFTGFDENDNRQLHRLKRQRPYHVINATLNLISKDNLAWQTRKAASFTLSGLHCGNWLLGYRRSNEYSRSTYRTNCKHLRFCNRFDRPCDSVEQCTYPGKAIRLGTAMAISGAAADPNMGYYSSSVVTFLLALFNIRLGWWLGNTGRIGDEYDGLIFRKFGWFYRNARRLWDIVNYFQPSRRFFEKSSPTVAMFPLLNETIGRTSVDKRFLNVTDGGHFENLALYEMVMRRCKFLVVSDAAADEKFTFGELSNAIEKCRVDLGVEIQFRHGINIYSRYSSDDERNHGQRFAVAEITYPETDSDGENLKGCLLYFRPTLNGSEPISIKHYADSNSTFPHQSTGDQFFDEHQFEAYRLLGFLTFEEILESSGAKDISELIERLTA
jgi:hypothetical protein